MALTYDALATTTTTTSTASVTFSNISQNYTDLKVCIVTKGTSNITISSTSTGRYLAMWGDGAGGYGQVTGTTSNPIYLTNAYGLNDHWSGILFDIFGYSSSYFKTISYKQANSGPESSYIEAGIVLWQNTTAVTSLTINAQNSFPANSTISIYGIKVA